MRRSIELGGRRVDYVLERKRVKRVNFRFSSDGMLHVSAPRLLPLALVEGAILSRRDWILTAQERLAQKTAADDALLSDGSTVVLWGEALTLRLREGSRSGVRREGDSLVLTVRDPSDEDLKRQALETWRKRVCREEMTALCERFYPCFQRRGVAFPAISIRCMRSRWGSCRPQKRAVSFNTRLTELPRACAEYVAVHELCHFLHQDHSPAFYAEVERILPDWKEGRALIRTWEKSHLL